MNMSDLDFSDISMEQKGMLVPGRLKLTDTQIHFKPKSGGKISSISGSDLDLVNWLRHASIWALRIFTNNGSLIRFTGFKESDKDKLSKAFTNRFGKTMMDMDVGIKGWNWGSVKFKGSALTFDIANSHGFDVPLAYVSQCTTGKNEVTLEFHQNDDARDASLMELRFHMPSSETGDEPVEIFKDHVLSKADVIGAVGDAVAIFREIHCVTPRGRYDIKVYQKFFQLHGKTFDYKIPMTTVLRLFLLPHVDGRQIHFVVSLDPPIKQGQTRYPYLVFLFPTEEECSIDLPFTEQELKSKYGGKLEKEIIGATYHVVSRIMKVLMDRKITGPGKYLSNASQPAVAASYRAAAGFLYPLERGFMFVHKPPIHIRFDEITGVNFVRSGGGTKSFDFEIELKSGIVHSFVSIVKEEYGKLYSYVSDKGIRVKSQDKIEFGAGKFDGKAEPDAYLARVKAEAEERSDEGSDTGSEDEDYNPEASKLSDVAEEFDSDASSPSSAASNASAGSEKKKTRSKKPAKKEKQPKVKPSSKEKSSRANKKKTEKPASSAKKDAGRKASSASAGSGDQYKSKEFISSSEDDNSSD